MLLRFRVADEMYSRVRFANSEKPREFQSIQIKIRKIGMSKTREMQGELCVSDISQQNATLKNRANLRVAYDCYLLVEYASISNRADICKNSEIFVIAASSPEQRLHISSPELPFSNGFPCSIPILEQVRKRNFTCSSELSVFNSQLDRGIPLAKHMPDA